MINVKLNGFREFNKRIKDADIINAVQPVVELEMSREIREEIDREVPVDTGRLRDGWRTETGAISKDRTEVRTVSDVDYGVYVNYGTARQPANDFMGRAFDNWSEQAKNRIEQEALQYIRKDILRSK